MMQIAGTFLKIDTRDMDFYRSLDAQGRDIDHPAEFFGKKWNLKEWRWSSGHPLPEGFHGELLFQRLEEVK
jgi:hypothetical protein